MLFTDTDAAGRYDFSEYPLDHPLYSVSNHKALGFFKDELNSIPMQKFVGLRPKCYAFLCTGKVDRNMPQHVEPVEKKTAKGVKCKVNDDHLHFAHYLDTLRSFQSYVCKQNLISSSVHTVRTVHTHKVALTAFDTKRWLCEDTIHTHSHGHKDTVADPVELVNKSFIVECIAHSGVFGLSGPVPPPPASPGLSCDESPVDSGWGSDSLCDSGDSDWTGYSS